MIIKVYYIGSYYVGRVKKSTYLIKNRLDSV